MKLTPAASMRTTRLALPGFRVGDLVELQGFGAAGGMDSNGFHEGDT